jgi:hypothetical protein
VLQGNRMENPEVVNALLVWFFGADRRRARAASSSGQWA